jgi:predicted aspartyl protease
MPSYDGVHHDPPAPIAHVIIRGIDSHASVPDVHLLLDTGADITLLPRAAVEKLGVKPLSGIEYKLLGLTEPAVLLVPPIWT